MIIHQYHYPTTNPHLQTKQYPYNHMVLYIGLRILKSSLLLLTYIIYMYQVIKTQSLQTVSKVASFIIAYYYYKVILFFKSIMDLY